MSQYEELKERIEGVRMHFGVLAMTLEEDMRKMRVAMEAMVALQAKRPQLVRK